MSDKVEKLTIINEIREELEKLISLDSLSEAEKADRLRTALMIMKGPQDYNGGESG